MWTPDTKQWWVIWLTAALVLAFWWSTAPEAVERRAATDPIILRLKQEHTTQTLKILQAPPQQIEAWSKMANDTLHDLVQRRAALERAEYQPRVIITILLAGVFVIWLLELRRKAQRAKTAEPIA